MKHERLDDGAREDAAFFALGSMSRSEAEAYEKHLAQCGTCWDEVAAVRATIADLILATPTPSPREGLKSRLLERISGPPLTLLRGKEALWRPTGLPGVEVSILFIDQVLERQTVLLRMQAGAVYPDHGHRGPEECYVIEGDVSDGEATLNAGDYARYAVGSHHGPLTTEQGCLLLIQSARGDERLSTTG
jgi:anti-sigma factor ChrR (cupin superfamily)